MKYIDNRELFEFSLTHPEPIIDEFYLKNGNLIISEDAKSPTDATQKNFDLLESVSTYNFAKKNKDGSIAEKALEKMLEIMQCKNINYSEFVSFWPVADISYSLFGKMNLEEQRDILRNIVEKYIELRHVLYLSYGYTPITLQVSKDAKAHKESGNLGIYKVSKILDDAGYRKSNDETPEEFLLQDDKKYIEADKKGKGLFKNFLHRHEIKFLWSKKKEQKMPDFLIKDGDDIFILEHKHMKEGGGGQDKQINEIISLIGFNENNPKIHYISFLDGMYFNLLASTKHSKNGKLSNQIKNIKKNLNRNKQNYFVNTAGFKKLFEISQ